MFRPMRRNKQALSPAQCEAVLARGSSGVLAVSGDDGYPYAVPLSYVYAGGRLYFHCAAAGHKLDAVRRCPKASFCVIDQDRVVPEEYTTYFRSVIVFGQVRELTDAAEKRAAVLQLSASMCQTQATAPTAPRPTAFGRRCACWSWSPNRSPASRPKSLQGPPGTELCRRHSPALCLPAGVPPTQKHRSAGPVQGPRGGVVFADDVRRPYCAAMSNL